jgi:peroxiredoxin
MRFRKGLFALLLLVVLVVSACGGVALAPEAAEKGAEAIMEKEAAGTMTEAGSADATMGETTPEAKLVGDTSDAAMPVEDDVMTDLPAWFGAQLTDVHTGETLTVADLKGKVVLVETMAIWCPSCLRQQQEVKALHEALGERDDLVTLVLDVDPNEDAEDLKAYADKNGFTWTYAVAPREVAREIGQLYGDQFLNPPSTPMFIVDQQGQVHLLPFGRKTAGDLQEALAPFLSEGM